MSDLPPRAGDDAGDALLLERARAGDSDAFASLYEQEVDAARRLARILVGEDKSEELVAESFARVLTQLKAGRGPTDDFRAYLHVTIRNGFRDSIRAPKESPSSDQPWLLDDVLPPVEELVEDLDRDVAVSALATLPKSWQQVLWHLEVEGRKPAEVAGLLDMEAGAVSSLAYRAREGLKRAYLDQHLQPVSGGLCGWTQSRMSQYVRGDLSSRAEGKVAAHVDTCSVCSAAFLTVERVNHKLAAWLFPVVLWGITGAKKGGLLWFAGGAGGAGGGAAAGNSGSGPSPNPLLLGVAGAAIACGIAGGVALAVTAGGDKPPADDTNAVADGSDGDAAPPPAQSTNEPPADQSPGDSPTSKAADRPPATTPSSSALPPTSTALTDPTASESSSSSSSTTSTSTATTSTTPSTSTTTSTAPSTSTTPTTTTTTVIPDPVVGGIDDVVVTQVASARAAGQRSAPVVHPYSVTVISHASGEAEATIEMTYTFEDNRIVNALNPAGNGWTCDALDVLVLAGQPVTCTFDYVGASPPPVALKVTNVLQPNQPQGTVTMTIDDLPGTPGQMGF